LISLIQAKIKAPNFYIQAPLLVREGRVAFAIALKKEQLLCRRWLRCFRQILLFIRMSEEICLFCIQALLK
jgi:hypothetical protein